MFRNKFYEVFYGAFDDQCAAMDTILSGKECFARQVKLLSWWKMPLGFDAKFYLLVTVTQAIDKF